MIELKNWSFQSSRYAYGLPKPGNRVYGDVYNHPDSCYPDGKQIISSNVHSIEDKKVTTRSGTVYLLVGEPCRYYAKWHKMKMPD